jgi:hypothetical protein
VNMVVRSITTSIPLLPLLAQTLPVFLAAVRRSAVVRQMYDRCTSTSEYSQPKPDCSHGTSINFHPIFILAQYCDFYRNKSCSSLPLIFSEAVHMSNAPVKQPVSLSALVSLLRTLLSCLCGMHDICGECLGVAWGDSGPFVRLAVWRENGATLECNRGPLNQMQRSGFPRVSVA